MELNLNLILSTAGLLMGVCAIITAFVLHAVRGERQRALIEAHLQTFLRNSEETLELSKKTLYEASQLTTGQEIRPELSTYLSNQWMFIEKTFHNRFEKHDICRRIVTGFMKSGDTILLDSGSSVDLVTSELLTSRFENVHVYSNNVFAAVHLVGTTRVTLTLFAGEFSDRFAATYSPEFNNRIRDLPIRVFVMAATAFRAEIGITVDEGDRDNADFKAAALRAFSRGKSSRLIIAVDATKFVEPLGKHKPVVEQGEWQEMLVSYARRIAVVSSRMRPEADPEDIVHFEQEVGRLRKKGIQVDLGNGHHEQLELRSE